VLVFEHRLDKALHGLGRRSLDLRPGCFGVRQLSRQLGFVRLSQRNPGAGDGRDCDHHARCHLQAMSRDEPSQLSQRPFGATKDNHLHTARGNPTCNIL